MTVSRASSRSSTARSGKSFACTDCGFNAPRWFGRCPDCGSWSTAADPGTVAEEASVTTLAGDVADPARRPTGIDEVDRVLGGGLVEGGVLLLAGEPGIGKSTLMLEVLGGLTRSGCSTLLVSGEESLAQVSARAARLGVERSSIRALAGTRLSQIVSACEKERPQVLVVDSVQTLDDPDVESVSGSVNQVRSCTARLVHLAKTTGTSVVLVGHVTKDGNVAGPKTLEHMVDAVVVLEGERSGTLRLLRAAKNRFGPCDETGVFVMERAGLQPVSDPSRLLLEGRQRVPGAVIFPSIEGARPVLVELQVLLAHGRAPQTRMIASGVDAKRVALMTAVVERRAGLDVAGHDIFVSSSGGITIRDAAVDLAIALAFVSAARDAAFEVDVAVFGEVGLGGEVRAVPAAERRIAEAARLGFRRAVVPKGAAATARGIEVVEVSSVRDAFAQARLA